MILIDANKKCYKGNTHAHTSCSDGRKSPEEVKALFAAHGYDFLAITDHRIIGPMDDSGKMLVLSGIEYNYEFKDQVLHLIGIFPDAKAADGISCYKMAYQELIDAANARGGAVIAAHPAWSLNTPEFLEGLKGVCAAEVYNSFSNTPWNAARADSGLILDVAATHGWVTPHVAADDCHFYEGEQCRSYTMVQADELTPNGVISALKKGAFYASQGPEILSAEIQGDELILRTSPVNMCTFYSNLVWVDGRCRRGDGMTEHIYKLHRDEGESFIRCEITDAQGRRAWLSPVKL